MSDLEFRLTDAFPSPSLEQWRAVAEASLQGRPVDGLATPTCEGATYRPLYTAADAHAAPPPPGTAPFTRGAALPRGEAPGWEIRQDLLHPDPAAVRAAAREEIAGGAEGLILRLDPSGLKGVIAPTAAALGECLADVDLRAVPVAVEAGPFFARLPEILEEVWRTRGLDPAAARGSYLADPITPLLAKGRLPVPLETLLAELGALGARCHAAGPGMTAAKVSTCPAHNAGAGADQELGLALAVGLTYLRALTDAGLGLGDAARQLQFCFSTGGTFFLDLAKLRAARSLWARLIEASGGAPADGAMTLHARTSLRMFSVRDPWVNMLRATAGAFAAACGGADIVTVTPFDHLLGPSDAFARRIARNVPIILREECHLDWVADPAGGSWFLESLTDELAEAGWAFFQAIEAQGGLAAAVRTGWLQARVDETWQERRKRLAVRRDPVIGVSEFPNLAETLPERPTPDLAAIAARWGAPGSLAREAARPDAAEPLPERRTAAPFEALRDAADAHLAAHGARPRVLLATLGPVARHTARAGWTRNVLEAGGLDVIASGPCADAAAVDAAARAAGCRTAVLCGADPDYEAWGEDAARALKDAGAARVILAGRLGDRADAWRAAGVDHEVRLGTDILEFLRGLLRAEGVEA
ncbi:MAG TPA: methylmalonyl-CoA mutase family protein [Candidatus Krumholzibacteria bacterium]|nr:methylmalonyl-CoA mutase family protein [Candidatus Krumholzibacteria bacterium]